MGTGSVQQEYTKTRGFPGQVMSGSGLRVAKLRPADPLSGAAVEGIALKSVYLSQ